MRQGERERERGKGECQAVTVMAAASSLEPTRGDNFTKLFPDSRLVNCTDIHRFPSSAEPHYISSLDVITIRNSGRCAERNSNSGGGGGAVAER